MKPTRSGTSARGTQVTPFVGVWIETVYYIFVITPLYVTPFVGVWIETNKLDKSYTCLLVTPFVGVWIETLKLVISSRI